MGGKSTGYSHPRACSGRKTLRRCRNNEEADDVILIDLDSEHFDNVIIIDVPDSLPKKWRDSIRHKKDKKRPSRNVIWIDDDEIPNSNDSCTFVGASSSRKSFPLNKDFEPVEEFQFSEENATPVRLSKCKRTYSGKSPAGNRYGLNDDSEDLSDDDCELVEDNSGKVQEQWERAFSRRRKDINHDQSGTRDHEGTSRAAGGNYQQNVRRKSETTQFKETTFGSDMGKFSNEFEGPSTFSKKEDVHYNGTYIFRDPFLDDFSSNVVPKQQPQNNKSDACGTSGSQGKAYPCPTAAYKDEDECPIFEPSLPKSKPCANETSCHGKASSVEDEVTINKGQNSFETEVEGGKSFQRHEFKKFQGTATGCFKEKIHLETRAPHVSGSVKEKITSGEIGSVPGESFLFKNSSSENRQPITDIHLSEAKLRQDDYVSISQREKDKDDQSYTENRETVVPEEYSIINEREKLKQTDEYKKATEEEWASRQRALQKQAEEAQHLRRLVKRKIVESMRLLDMERRQKQRIEEIRIAQKKDEENMNLKDVVRAQVRKDLQKLETTCINMASLLHSMGIHVGGWPNPMPQEVQAAYKRALLTFHPDRASRSDIRHQVESEEKFKLINRLKENFLSSK